MIARSAAVADAAAIARVHVDSWRSTYRGLMPDEVLAGLSYEERENNWIGILNDRTKFTFVAEEAGSVVGFANGGPERSQDPGYRGEMYALYFLERHQRRGGGRDLARVFVERLRHEGYASMLVWVLAANLPARKFYESLGGVEIRTKRVRVHGTMLDHVAYGWTDLAMFGATDSTD
jgi:ribosomal protein S18 acetylase RimI-like enzyme